ncbi:MAG: hypothetical protein ACLPPF_24205, partial [Rhodomicrobium sp.]
FFGILHADFAGHKFGKEQVTKGGEVSLLATVSDNPIQQWCRNRPEFFEQFISGQTKFDIEDTIRIDALVTVRSPRHHLSQALSKPVVVE